MQSPLPADWSRIMGSTSSGGVDAPGEFLLIVLWRTTHVPAILSIYALFKLSRHEDN